MAPRVGEAIAEARAAAAAGIAPPRIVLQRSLEQLDGFLARAPKDNVFVTSFLTWINAMTPALPPAERETAIASTEKVVADVFIPAYRRIHDLLSDQVKTARTCRRLAASARRRLLRASACDVHEHADDG